MITITKEREKETGNIHQAVHTCTAREALAVAAMVAATMTGIAAMAEAVLLMEAEATETAVAALAEGLQIHTAVVEAAMVPREATAVWEAHHTVEGTLTMVVADLLMVEAAQAEAMEQAEAITVAVDHRMAEAGVVMALQEWAAAR